MAIPIQRGNIYPQLQKQTGRYSPINGWTFDQEFRGLDSNQMLILANQYAVSGCEYEITLQAGTASMRTTDNRGNVTIDLWEIGVDNLAVTSVKNPRNVANISFNDLTAISKAVNDGLQPDEAVASLNTIYASTTPPIVFTLPDLTLGTYAGNLYFRMKIRGETDFQSSRYTLRHTTNASNRGYYNVADNNIDCIYTQAQFYAEIRNRSDWLFPAPNEIIGALDVAFNSLLAAPAYYLQGALKGGSPRSTAVNNRVNIVTEYKIFNWSVDEYGTAV